MRVLVCAPKWGEGAQFLPVASNQPLNALSFMYFRHTCGLKAFTAFSIHDSVVQTFNIYL